MESDEDSVGEVLCENCEDDAASVFCAECGLYYCSTCCPILHKSTKKRAHRIELLDNAEEDNDEYDGAMSADDLISSDEMENEPGSKRSASVDSLPLPAVLPVSSQNSTISESNAPPLPAPPSTELPLTIAAASPAAPPATDEALPPAPSTFSDGMPLPPPPTMDNNNDVIDSAQTNAPVAVQQSTGQRRKAPSTPQAMVGGPTPTNTPATVPEEGDSAPLPPPPPAVQEEATTTAAETAASDMANFSDNLPLPPPPVQERSWTRTEEDPQPVAYLEWGVNDVATFIDNMPPPLNCFADLFANERIRGRNLPRLNPELLQQMGVKDADNQRAILNEIIRLRLKRQMNLVSRLINDVPEWMEGVQLEDDVEVGSTEHKQQQQQTPSVGNVKEMPNQPSSATAAGSVSSTTSSVSSAAAPPPLSKSGSLTHQKMPRKAPSQQNFAQNRSIVATPL